MSEVPLYPWTLDPLALSPDGHTLNPDPCTLNLEPGITGGGDATKVSQLEEQLSETRDQLSMTCQPPHPFPLLQIRKPSLEYFD